MANIKSNNYRNIDCRIIDDVYMDFMLSKAHVIEHTLDKSDMATSFNFNHVNDKTLLSDTTWNDAITSTTILENIGYTGVDNGLISYEKDRINNNDFLNIFTKSTLDLSKYSDKFFITEVDGNTNTLNYPIEKCEDYVSLKGGFYQGFFKIDGDKYQVLPNDINDEWNFNFVLRRKDYDTIPNTLNHNNPNNKGIFFYIGTRAENKFWELYKNNITTNPIEISTDGVLDCQYTEDSYLDANDCNSYFSDEEYIEEQMSLDNIQLTDSEGFNVNEKGNFKIKTDNKFIFMNRTKDGYTYKNWKDEYYTLTGKTDSPNINYFTYLNRTKDGYTYKNIHELEKEHAYSYDVFKDIENNALAFKINDDGSIGYRYLSTNCEIIEEYSKSNLISLDDWYNITVKIVNKPSSSIECSNTKGVMQLYFYVNGKLKFISKDLPKINLRGLNDTPQRQEGVPYNISIGGGTQGLCERIQLDYYNVSDYVLPLEQHFAGTFIGDIKSFSFTPNRVVFSASHYL